MARKRLNKKVAFIGSAVFALVAIFVIYLVLRATRDPSQFLEDAEAALAVKDYETAERNYGRAFGKARSSEIKIEILSKMSDLYITTSEWRKARGCWERTVTIDPCNVEARMARLKFIYIAADSLSEVRGSTSGYWKEVRDQATELTRIVRTAGIESRERAEWDVSFGTEESGYDRLGGKLMGPFLQFVRGRALLELSKMGAVEDPDQVLVEAIRDLDKVVEQEPDNVDAYRYLADAMIEKGGIAASRGNIEQRDVAAREAAEILERAVEAAPDEPHAYIYALSRKLLRADKAGVTRASDHFRSLESDYAALAQKFPGNADVLEAVSTYYSYYALSTGPDLSPQLLDKAIAAAEEAMSLSKDSIEHARTAVILYRQKFLRQRDTASLEKLISAAEHALTLPWAQESTGPRYQANLRNRLVLHGLLAECCIEQIVRTGEDDGQTDAASWLRHAEAAVHEIEQILASGENPEVIKWQGMLELAKGNKDVAVQKLYTTYEQFKARSSPGRAESLVPYTLARIFRDTNQSGAVVDFLTTALNAGIARSRPQSLLDCAEALLRVRSPDFALTAVNSYEEQFGSDSRSKSLRVQALIAKGHVSEAEAGLGKLDSESAESISLWMELVGAKVRQLRDAIRLKQPEMDAMMIFRSASQKDDQLDVTASVAAMEEEVHSLTLREADLLGLLVAKDPNKVSEQQIGTVCQSLIAAGELERARRLVGTCVPHFLNSPAIVYYQLLLAQPDPKALTVEQRSQLQAEAIRKIADPVLRDLHLGIFSHREGQDDKAIELLQGVLRDTASHESLVGPKFRYSTELSPAQRAAAHLFDIARLAENWQLAEQVVQVARERDLDRCQGQLFGARLAFAQGKHDEALARLDECVKLRPVFAYVYVLRGNIRTADGNELESIKDLRKAFDLNRMNPLVAKSLANAYYVRNKTLGESVSTDQEQEAKRALEVAILLNPYDVVLLGAYADYVSKEEPLKALALRQTLHKREPTLPNAVEMGKLAMRIGLKERDAQRREAFFKMAEASFEQAKQMDPQSQLMLQAYAEYYRAREQYDKAQQLLESSQDSQLLWRHYYRLGRLAEAKKVLEQEYASDQGNKDALKGLVIIGQKLGDREAVRRYSEELLTVEDTTANRIGQVQAYLDVGLVREAGKKLESLKERYPNEPSLLRLEAYLAMREGRMPVALELINRALERHQDDAGTWRLRGQINLRMQNYDQAIIDLKRSKSLAKSPATRVALAKAYLQAGRDEDAIVELKSTIAQEETPAEARTLLEGIYVRQGKVAALKEFYENALKDFPGNISWLMRAAWFSLSVRDYDTAEKYYAEAYRLKTDQVAATDSAQDAIQDMEFAAVLDGYLRTLNTAAGEPNTPDRPWRPEKLEKVFAEGRRYGDGPYGAIAFYRMAEAKMKLGDRETGVAYCRKAVDKAWSNEKIAVELLLRLFLLLGPEEVSKYCQERLADDPNSLPANFTMYNLSKVRGDFAGALGYIDRCVSIAGADTQQGIAYLKKKTQLLALAYDRTSDNRYLEQAIADYESLLGKTPKSTEVLNNLAYMLAQSGRRLGEALEYARRALEANPDNANFLDTYGYVLHRGGKNREAVRSLASAIQQYEQNGAVPAEVYEHLGMVNEALGDTAKALAAYKQALEAGSDRLPMTTKERISSAIERLTQ